VIRAESPSLRANLAQLQSLSKNFKTNTKRIVGTLARGMRTEVVKAAGDVFTAKKTRLLKAFKVVPNLAELSFNLIGFRHPISGLSFRLTESKRGGLRIKFERDKPAKVFKTGFLEYSIFPNDAGTHALVPWKRNGDAKRIMKAGRYAGATTRRGKPILREPIIPIYGPSAARMLDNPKVLAPLTAAFFARAEKEVLRLIESELKTRG
jgi:hypothetical protein